jgi:hypothetical protein
MSGVFAVAAGLNFAMHADVKIPDIRIELRSKRTPGTRVETVLPRPETPGINGERSVLLRADFNHTQRFLAKVIPAPDRYENLRLF